MRIAVRSFETGGEVRRVSRIRSFFTEALNDGWIYITAPAGTTYLSFIAEYGPDTWDEIATRWRIDIPDEPGIVYAGTAVIGGTHGWLNFRRNISRYFIEEAVIHDESDLAQAVVDRAGLNLGPMRTAIMQRHEGPLTFSTPTE